MEKKSKLDIKAEQALEKEFNFDDAKPGKRLARGTTKVHKNFRIDLDILTWLQHEADSKSIGYQTYMNMILRQVMTGELTSQTRYEAEVGSLSLFDIMGKRDQLYADTLSSITNTLEVVLLDFKIDEEDNAVKSRAEEILKKIRQVKTGVARIISSHDSVFERPTAPASRPRSTKKVAAGSR